MWNLAAPATSGIESYLLCISKLRGRETRDRFTLSAEAVRSASELYIDAAKVTALHQQDKRDFELPTVNTTEMSNLYKNSMVRSNSPGRAIYDDLLLGAPQGRCPLCGQRDASTLDHHLPKAHYPALAVDPTNLVPACKDCNHVKLDLVPTKAEEEGIHPYFDELGDEQWLKADLVAAPPAALHYFVAPPKSWSNLLASRAIRHFTLFRLAPLYASQAAQEISSIKYGLNLILARGGQNAVMRHLSEEAASRRVDRVNSWQTAMYSCLAASESFCGGGFNS